MTIPPARRSVSLPHHCFIRTCTPGTVCLSILDGDKGWRPSITVKQILLGIQDLLDTPNAADPANGEAYELFTKSKAAYDVKIRQIAAANVMS